MTLFVFHQHSVQQHEVGSGSRTRSCAEAQRVADRKSKAGERTGTTLVHSRVGEVHLVVHCTQREPIELSQELHKWVAIGHCLQRKLLHHYKKQQANMNNKQQHVE